MIAIMKTFYKIPNEVDVNIIDNRTAFNNKKIDTL